MKRVKIREILHDPVRRKRLEEMFMRGIKSIPRDGTHPVKKETTK